MIKSVLFSGGRTSGLMLRKLLDLYPDYRERFVTIFCNTGKEMSQTLDFVHEVETRWDVPIVWLEYQRTPARHIPDGTFPTEKRNANHRKLIEANAETHWFKTVKYDTASRNGEPFDALLEWMTVLPNVVSRGCSMQLKIRTAMRYLFSLGLKEYGSIIGIRKDEEQRSVQILANADPFEHPEFPLIEMGITVEDVDRFWKQSPFDLQLRSHEGNCDLCFLKAKWKRILIAAERPELLLWWKDWESKKAGQPGQGDGKFFRLGEPYSLIEDMAVQSKKQPEFCFVGAGKDIPCSCAERGFGSEDEE